MIKDYNKIKRNMHNVKCLRKSHYSRCVELGQHLYKKATSTIQIFTEREKPNSKYSLGDLIP